jgi:threonine dehydratase
VITHSSGNHGQAVAYAAARYGVPAVVVVPNVSPAVKVDAVRRLGAEVVLVEPAERFRAARELAAARGLTLVPPYDDPDVIAGQGTVALEVLADLPDVDVVLVPVGGGGLASGVGAAVKAIRPETAVYGVEPDAAPTPATRSRRGGSSRTRTSSGTPRSPTGCAPRCPS